MLRVSIAALIVGFLPCYVAAQATCASGFDWAFNTLGQSPCDVATELGGVCVGGQFSLQPLSAGFVYLGPSAVNANSCRCSSVYYSMLSACGACQNRNFIRWSTYKTNCTTVYAQIFPQPIPTGVRVPHYAYLDVETADTFNLTVAQNAGGTDSTAIPSPTGTSGGSTPGATKGGSKVNAGAIAGGVVGGIVGLAVIAGLVFWLLRRRRQTSSPSSAQDHVLPSQTPMSYAGTGGTYAPTSMTPKIYDPNDPTTYPSNDHSPAGYNPYTPSPDLHQQQPYVAPNFTGTTVQSTQPPSRPHYTGAPELG
ncbi:hypothetical protein B0H34DRAFT_795165 [Crassisporium funariophilum]|nr:hypothetical protein B0H34DRAFT_795165 [Crassisporium funariophilum]